MITDSIDNCSLYYNLHKHFSTAFQFILKTDLTKLSLERHDIINDDVYIILSEFNGKPLTEAKPECHKKYIDIHFLLSGNESIGYSPKCRCKEFITEYDSEKDFELYNEAPETVINMQPNDFAIFFPEDAHAPGISDNKIFKAVVKIKIE